MYTMNDCPFCIRAKAILKELDVPYEEKNISTSTDLHRELIERTKDDKLPTIIINDDVLLIKPGEDKLRATINYERYR
jgi:thioredoxin reductase (NADPH)